MAKSLILVVDDDPVTLTLMAATLREAGYRVLTAAKATAAFRLLETRPGIAMLITDVVMPGIDGLALADMVKLRHPEIRIIYATGAPEVTARQPGYRYGPTVHKPIGDQLASLVGELLARPADRHGFRPPLPLSAGDGGRVH
jgi:CheY-like chemotaxis protein